MSTTLSIQALARPLLAALALLFAVALLYNGRRHAWKLKRRKASLYRCAACDRVYADLRNVPLSACPNCGQLNEATRR